MGGKSCKGSGRETKSCQGAPCPSEWVMPGLGGWGRPRLAGALMPKQMGDMWGGGAAQKTWYKEELDQGYHHQGLLQPSHITKQRPAQLLSSEGVAALVLWGSC